MLHLTVNQGDGVPIYLQLVQQIKRLVATRRLQADSELPPVRVLAQQLVLNPNTVVRAYRELEVAGVIYKRRGAGTYIAETTPSITRKEQKKILAERADALLAEARQLDFDFEEVVGLLREREAKLESHGRGEKKKEKKDGREYA